MANVKITDLDLIPFSSITVDDVFPIVDVSGDTTYKINLNQLSNYLSGFNNRWYIESGETITVRTNTQSFIYNDLIVYGNLVLEDNSKLFVVNGSIELISGGTIFNEGDIILIDLPEFDTKVTDFTYNNNEFTISNNIGSSYSVSLNEVTGLTVNGNFSATTISASSIDLCGTNGTLFTDTISGCSPINILSFTIFNEGLSANTISATTYNNLPDNVTGFYLPLSGGTVTGSTTFTNGLTANTISATTYNNLPQDIFVTGGTYTNGEILFKNNSGGSFTVSGLPIGGAGGEVYYLNLSQTQTPYQEFSPIGTNLTEQTTGVTINSGVTSTITSFLTPTGYPNTTTIPAGFWSFYLHSYKDTINASFDVFCEVYVYTTGGTETLILTTAPTEVTTYNPTTSMELTDGYYSGGTIDITDRILVKVRTTNTGSQTNTITFFTEGQQNYSYGITPFSNFNALTCETLSGCTTIINLENNKVNKSGDTMTGTLIVPTISATTYQNLPLDVFVTGGTFSSGTATFRNNTGGTFNVTGFTSGGGNFLPLSGGTVTGDTIFTQNITANTVNSLRLGIGGGNINSNIALGTNSLQNNTTGNYNVSLGRSSLLSNTTGSNNISLGRFSLYCNTTGSCNVSLGFQSLFRNTIGVNNVAIGRYSLTCNVSGYGNVSIGNRTLYSNTSGCRNVGIGYFALNSNTTGDRNISIGDQTLRNNTTGGSNIAFGYGALRSNTTGFGNVSIGSTSLCTNTGGTNNIAIGSSSLQSNVSGSYNVSLGRSSLGSNTTGGNNISLGRYSLQSNTTGGNNISLGQCSLRSNTTGCQNIAIGDQSLRSNIGGVQNISLGYCSLVSNTTGSLNIGLGRASLRDNTTGSFNVALGYSSLRRNTTGLRNVAIGEYSLQENTTGTHNIGIGQYSLRNNTTASFNIGLSHCSLRSNTTGCNNIGLGRNSLRGNTTGNFNIALGYQSLGYSSTGSNNVALGQSSLRCNTSGCYNISLGQSSLRNNTIGLNNISIGLNSSCINVTGSTNVAIGCLTQTGNFSNSVILGAGATAGSNNEFVVGSTGTTLGTITTESCTSTKTWQIRVNGNLYKLLLV